MQTHARTGTGRTVHPMTHEITANGEHANGPEHDHSLPDADSIPGDLSPADSDAPLMTADL